jgi:hypothetical protein
VLTEIVEDRQQIAADGPAFVREAGQLVEIGQRRRQGTPRLRVQRRHLARQARHLAERRCAQVLGDPAVSGEVFQSGALRVGEADADLASARRRRTRAADHRSSGILKPTASDRRKQVGFRFAKTWLAPSRLP